MSMKTATPRWKKHVVFVTVPIAAIVLRGTISLIEGKMLEEAFWDGLSEINIMNTGLLISLWYGDEIGEWWKQRTALTGLQLRK